jgi:hypothetical protein
VSTHELEARIRRIDGVMTCEVTDTEVVVFLAQGANSSAVASLVGHLANEAVPGRIVRLMGVTPATPPARSRWPVAGWVIAGALALVALVLGVALASDDDPVGNVAPPKVPGASVVRTSSTTARLTTTTSTTELATTSTTTAAAPATTAAPTTTSTAPPPPAYSVERHLWRQDNDTLTLTGAIVNESRSTHSYRVTGEVLDRAGRTVANGTTDVLDVPSGARRDWTIQASYAGDLIAEGGSCRVSARILR